MKTVKLGELVKITIGRTPSRGNEDFWDKDKNTSNVWLSIADLLNADGKVVNDSKEYITDEAAKTFAIVPQGTLLVSFKLTLGRLAYAGKDLRTNEAIAALHNDQTKVTNDYLYHYLSRFDWNEYAKADQKVKGLTLNKAKLAEVTVTYPESLEEQQRIVAWLDAAFEKIDRAIGLTNKNLRNARDFFTNELTKTIKGVSDTTVELRNICDFRNGFAFKSNTFRKDGVPLLRISNIQQDILSDHKLTFIDTGDYKENLDSYIVKPDDLVIAMSGATTGKIAINNTEGVYLQNQRVGRFIPSPKLDTRFLFYVLKTKAKENLHISKGSAQPNLSTEQIKSIPLPDISVEQQIKTSNRLDELSNQSLSLQGYYREKVDLLLSLKQSLLVQAFSQGEVK